MILCDTGIYFEVFKDNEKVKQEILKIGYSNLALCDLSLGEIYYGMKKGEERKTKELIRLFRRYHFSKEVSQHFIEIMSDQYGKKIKIPDAIIAAFARANNLKLFTLNVKDFRNIKGLELYRPKLKLK